MLEFKMGYILLCAVIAGRIGTCETEETCPNNLHR